MSFLQDYRTYTSGLEVPPSYNVFCSLVALAGLTNRRVYIMKGDYIRIYPNLYVILVGGPGLGKTTAMENVENLLHHFKMPVSAESVTREKLIMDINSQESIMSHLPADDKYRFCSPYNVFATELSEFLGAGGIGMISFLTDLYGRNIYEYRTKNKGSVFVNGPFVNLIAGTTPDWITNYLKDDIISGGFSRRCLFIHESSRHGSVPLPRITPAMRDAWKRVLARSEAIRKLQGPFVMSPEAEEFFIDWYPKRFGRPDPNLVGYYETKDIQMLKIAMLVAISEVNELVLEKRHMEAALDLLLLVEANLARVFQGIGRNELVSATSKVMDQLIMSPMQDMQDTLGNVVKVNCISEKRLRSFLWKEVNQLEMDAVIKHLTETDKIGKAVMDGKAVIFLKNSL